jgi:hypothetical protein
MGKSGTLADPFYVPAQSAMGDEPLQRVLVTKNEYLYSAKLSKTRGRRSDEYTTCGFLVSWHFPIAVIALKRKKAPKNVSFDRLGSLIGGACSLSCNFWGGHYVHSWTVSFLVFVD